MLTVDHLNIHKMEKLGLWVEKHFTLKHITPAICLILCLEAKKELVPKQENGVEALLNVRVRQFE